ncbi:unnamed protein product [Discula destructiva]
MDRKCLPVRRQIQNAQPNQEVITDITTGMPSSFGAVDAAETPQVGEGKSQQQQQHPPVVFPRFTGLPYELQQKIIKMAYEDMTESGQASPRNAYASISRNWQEVFEAAVFAKELTLRPQDLDDFERIVTGHRSRMIRGISLEIVLEDIDEEFWAGHNQESGHHITAAVTHWFQEQAVGSRARLIRLSNAVTSIFARLFQIIANWPSERSLSHLLQLTYSVYTTLNKAYQPLGGGSAAYHPILICDLGGLPEVASIGSLCENESDDHPTSIHPHTALTLLKRMPQVNSVELTLGSGIIEDWLVDAADTVKYLPTCAPQLRKLDLHLFQDCDWVKAFLAPNIACPGFQALSTSILQLRVTMPQLTHLTLTNVVDVRKFIYALMGGADTQDPLGRPEWSNLQVLSIEGYYNGAQDILLADVDAKHHLFKTMGNTLGHFPDLKSLNVKIKRLPRPPITVDIWLIPDQAFSITIRRASDVSSYVLGHIPDLQADESLLLVQGIDPRQCDIEVWKNVVLRHWVTGLATYIPDEDIRSPGPWKRVKYKKDETAEAGDSGDESDSDTDSEEGEDEDDDDEEEEEEEQEAEAEEDIAHSSDYEDTTDDEYETLLREIYDSDL